MICRGAIIRPGQRPLAVGIGFCPEAIVWGLVVGFEARDGIPPGCGASGRTLTGGVASLNRRLQAGFPPGTFGGGTSQPRGSLRECVLAVESGRFSTGSAGVGGNFRLKAGLRTRDAPGTPNSCLASQPQPPWRGQTGFFSSGCRWIQGLGVCGVVSAALPCPQVLNGPTGMPSWLYSKWPRGWVV